MRSPRWLPWALALLSGVMVGCCFPPFDNKWLGWLPWVALAPLCWALWILPRPDHAKEWARRAFLLGWVTGTVGFLFSLFWITTVTVPGWIVLSLVVGLYHGLWALFAGLVLRGLAPCGISSSLSWQPPRGLPSNGFAARSSRDSAGTRSESPCATASR